MLGFHFVWRKWLARWAVYIDPTIVSSSLTQVAFFLEKISNSVLLSRLDYGLRYATYNE